MYKINFPSEKYCLVDEASVHKLIQQKPEDKPFVEVHSYLKGQKIFVNANLVTHIRKVQEE